MKPLSSLLTVLSAVAFALLVPATRAVAQPPDSTTIAKLLQEAKVHAAAATEDAAFLASHAQSNFDPQMHSQYLRKVSEHASDLFQDYYQLQKSRDKGTPQQRDAIDRLDPLLREMATSLTNTVEAFNEHPARANMPYFRDRIHADWVSINKVYGLLCECTSKSKKA